MLKPMTARIIMFYLTSATVLLNCSIDSLTGGGGSDVGNGVVTGKIVTNDGIPAARTEVVLIPTQYDPVYDTSGAAFPIDTTNERGVYEFNAPEGKYNLLAVSVVNRTRTLIKNITHLGDTLFVSPDTLEWPGAVIVDVSSLTVAPGGYIYIPGTQIAASFSGTTPYATLDSIPAGLIPAIYYRLKNNTQCVLRYNVRIPPGNTIFLEKTEWKHSAHLFLNTTASGAQVYRTVVDFPLLVRLTAENFNFSNAKADGGDIRFTKSDNTPLRYEIERWDRANRKAELWVKVDTVFGNNATQYITMYWGNADASSNSDGSAVFDTASDYAAVWHLNKTCADVTENNYHGVNYGAADASGMIGWCKQFDGTDSIKINGLLGAPSNISISAWVDMDGASLLGQDVLSLGGIVLVRMDDLRSGYGTLGAFLAETGCNEAEYSVIRTGRILKYTGWHFITYSINTVENCQTFYIDGVQCCSKYCSHPPKYSGSGKNTFIGRHASYSQTYNFKGRVDEVRVCRKVLGSDWIRLCYMNQKSKDALMSMNYRKGADILEESKGH